MCGRYTLIRKSQIVEILQNITIKVDLAAEVARWNIAPSQDVLVITNRLQPTLGKARWGLIPHWAKDPAIGNRLINARAETLQAKPAFREALAKRRCAVLADGFYEWRKNDDGTKTPLYVRMRDGGLFAFAGLWEIWRNPAGQEIMSFTIVTTPPNKLLKPIHDRMPAILPREVYPACLQPDEMSAPNAQELLRPFPAEGMEAYPVRPLVNLPKNEGSELIVPAKDSPNERPETRAPREPNLFP
jgi:putative SOS response-associated peptidase YedK